MQAVVFGCFAVDYVFKLGSFKKGGVLEPSSSRNVAYNSAHDHRYMFVKGT